MKSESVSGGTEYVFVQFMECTLALVEVDSKLSCAFVMWSSTNEEDNTTVGVEGLTTRTELNRAACIGVEPFSAIRGMSHLVWDGHRISPLSKTLRWPYHGFYVNILYRDDLE